MYSCQGLIVSFPMALAPRSVFCPQAKVEMLDNLLDIEVAYSLLRGGSDDSSKDPIDVNYEKLKTDIKVRGLSFPCNIEQLTSEQQPQPTCAGGPSSGFLKCVAGL